MLMKKLLLLMFGLAIGFAASAQTLVTGIVIDEADQPLIGATVIVPGTTQGTSTDTDGSFRLEVKAGTAQIQISYLNYKTMLLDVNANAAKQDFGVIKLELDAIAMDDVVITQL